MEKPRSTPQTIKKAFTLVELLVVVGIIALLVAILVPSLQQARELANSSVCQANLKTVGLAMLLYTADNDYYMPPYYGDLSGADSVGYTGPPGSTHYSNWAQGVLMTFWFKGGNYPDPPRDGNGVLQPYTGSSAGGLGTILTCPTLNSGPSPMYLTWAGSGWDGWIWGERGFALNYNNVMKRMADGSLAHLKVNEIVNPSTLIYMADGSGWGQAIYEGLYDVTEQYTAVVPADRHLGNFNMVFCDGHVETGPLETFYQRQYIERNWGE